MSAARRARWRGLSISLAAGFIVWNVVFDRQVQDAASQYVRRQRLYAQGLGESVPMEEALRPALSRSAGIALGWGSLAVVAGLALTRSVDRKRFRPARAS